MLTLPYLSLSICFRKKRLHTQDRMVQTARNFKVFDKKQNETETKIWLEHVSVAETVF